MIQFIITLERYGELKEKGKEVKGLKEVLKSCKSKLEKIQKKLSKIKSLKQSLRNSEKKLEFEKECPTCHQLLTQEAFDYFQKEIEKKELEQRSLSESQSILQEEKERIQAKHQSEEKNFSRLKTQLIEEVSRELEQVGKTTGSIESIALEIQTEKEKLEKKKKEKESLLLEEASLKSLLQEMTDKIEYHEEAKEAFDNKKGIPTLVRKEILQEFQVQVDKWLNQFYYFQRNEETGLSAPFSILIREDPNTNKIIKTVKWHDGDTSERNLSSLSTAEYMRTHLAFFLAFSNLAEKKLQTRTNLLVFDECFSAVDEEGIICILEALNCYSKTEKIAIFIATIAPLFRLQFNWKQIFYLADRGKVERV